LARIIAEVRAHGSRHRGESARMIEFLAFSGLRISEAQRVHWEDVVVDGEGRWVMRVEGSKGRAGALRVRRLPVSDDLRRVLLDTVPGAQGREDLPAAGRMWHIKTPLVAMRNACARLGLRRWTVHDLRHYFATRCIECGVDVPTVSRWLGHSDGGVLAMRTYGHLRDAHSMEAVRRVVF
jgi:integrase